LRLSHKFIIRAACDKYSQWRRVALYLRLIMGLEEEQLNGGSITQLHCLLGRGKHAGKQEKEESD
jgi:hypothetical protein